MLGFERLRYNIYKIGLDSEETSGMRMKMFASFAENQLPFVTNQYKQYLMNIFH